QVHFQAPCANTVVAQFLLGFKIQLGRFKQRFAGNTADAQTGSAQSWFHFNAGHVESQLRRPNRRDVATWASPDYYQLMCLCGHVVVSNGKSISFRGTDDKAKPVNLT